MRNALIARSATCLVAIGGGLGTISETALALKLSKCVFAWREDVQLEGLQPAASVEELIDSMMTWLLHRFEGAGVA